MTGFELKKALKAGKILFSTLITTSDPKWQTHMKNLDLDFVFIDTEHISMNIKDVSILCQFFSSNSIPSIVRIPDKDPDKASVLLDAGASGIIAPYVETANEVKALVGAVKYKPLKGQKLKAFLNGEIILEDKLQHYLEDQNKNNLLFVNIESVPAVENLHSILAVSELDGIIIGPHDLSCSLGIPEEYGNPVFIETVNTIIDMAVHMHKAVGYHKGFSGKGMDQFIDWALRGMNIIIHEADIIASADKLKIDLEYLYNNINKVK